MKNKTMSTHHDNSFEMGKSSKLSTTSPLENFSEALEHKSTDVCVKGRGSSINKVEFLRGDA